MMFVFFFVSVLCCMSSSAQCTIAEADHYEVLRMVPKTVEQLQYLTELFDSSTDDGLDFWIPPRAVNKTVDIMIPPDIKVVSEMSLQAQNIKYTQLIPDVEKAINESENSNRRFSRRKRFVAYGFDFERYNDYPVMMDYLNTVVHMFPHIVHMMHIGWSHEGRNIVVMKIGSNPGHKKRGIWVDGGIHAREWPSPHVAIYFIHQLLTKYGKDRQITFMVDNLDWYIAPMINPDGYIFSRSNKHPKVRLWRKNRSPRTCIQDDRFSTFRENCCRGVDLNRNFDHYFQGRGTKNHQYYRASRSACNSNYAGLEPFSEPESKAMSDFLLNPKYNIDAFVSLHTYGQIVIHPYGHKRGYYPPNIRELQEVGRDAADALAEKFSTHYTIGSTADVLYLASGTAVDWAKSKAGIKFTFLLEMRPDRETLTNINSNTGGFLMEEKYLLPIAEETWEAMKVIAQAVLEHN